MLLFFLNCPLSCLSQTKSLLHIIGSIMAKAPKINSIICCQKKCSGFTILKPDNPLRNAAHSGNWLSPFPAKQTNTSNLCFSTLATKMPKNTVNTSEHKSIKFNELCCGFSKVMHSRFLSRQPKAVLAATGECLTLQVQ